MAKNEIIAENIDFKVEMLYKKGISSFTNWYLVVMIFFNQLKKKDWLRRINIVADRNEIQIHYCYIVLHFYVPKHELS